MSNFFKKNYKTIIFFLSLLFFVVITTLLLTEKIYFFDEFVFNGIKKLRSDVFTIVFKAITFLCSTEFLIAAIISMLLFSKNKKTVLFIALNTVLVFLFNQGLKLIFVRPRPENINLIVENGFSFPSGHSMVSLAFYGLLIYFILNMKIKKSMKFLYSILLVLLILLIGISRIYLGVHYASDVLAGFAISIVYLIIYIKIFHKKMER